MNIRLREREGVEKKNEMGGGVERVEGWVESGGEGVENNLREEREWGAVENARDQQMGKVKAE